MRANGAICWELLAFPGLLWGSRKQTRSSRQVFPLLWEQPRAPGVENEGGLSTTLPGVCGGCSSSGRMKRLS